MKNHPITSIAGFAFLFAIAALPASAQPDSAANGYGIDAPPPLHVLYMKSKQESLKDKGGVKDATKREKSTRHDVTVQRRDQRTVVAVSE